MDKHIYEAFLTALKISVSDSMLPIESSTFKS